MQPGMQPGMPPEAQQGPMPQQAPGQQQMPDETADDAADQDIFERILSAILEGIYGPNQKNIEKRLQAAKDVPQAVGRMTYAMIEDVSEKAARRQQEVGIDVLMGVATEVIDSLLRLAQSMRLKMPPEQEAREEALLAAVHAFTVNPKTTPEQQEIALQMLAEMTAEGDTAKAAEGLSQIGKRMGVDPFSDGKPQRKPRQLMRGDQ